MAEKSSLSLQHLSAFKTDSSHTYPPDKGITIKELSNLLRPNVLKMEKNT